ncbi:Reverse transcriptase domain-containing protein [Aphis craccivora]|uniref:Reverse transcriptase domain-containing protein n=1 Tax=Aphis craccivora TaxID=307492 RepID=A0A6G0VU43_APHCR|nr:Reverse transcriptase domain-containing protein [Aphis craccivora]
MASYNYISCIDSYTRVTETSMSCIDHIFIRNIYISKANFFVIKTDITDHFSLVFFIKDDFIDKIKDNIRHNNFNNKKTINFNILNFLISSFDWNSLLINNDVNILVDKFNCKINELITSVTKVTTATCSDSLYIKYSTQYTLMSERYNT